MVTFKNTDSKDRKEDGSKSLRSKTTNMVLDYVVSATGRRSGITIRSSNGTFFQQSHEFPHSICDDNLRIALHENV